jgi:hypothetical protein
VAGEPVVPDREEAIGRSTMVQDYPRSKQRDLIRKITKANLHLKVAKTPCVSYYLLCFFFNKSKEQEGGTCSAWRQGWGAWGEVTQIMYTHVSKCKNDKIK